jgi:hypothetical protein
MFELIYLNQFYKDLLISKYLFKKKFLLLKFHCFRNPQEKTNDPVLIATMIHCAKSVHDTLGFVY